jgi:DNA invertase Pin-like site-specific DNA recombinase
MPRGAGFNKHTYNLWGLDSQHPIWQLDENNCIGIMSAHELVDLEIVTGEKIGYARVSTEEQNLDMQVAALERVRCLRIFSEKVSATAKKREQLDEAIKNLRPGDTFVVWRLDRLARGMEELIARLKQVNAKGAGFMSLTERFDFGSASGKFMLNILGTVAAFERDITIERTKAGLAAARARGVKFGTELKMTDAKIEAIRQRILGGMKAKDACEAEGVSMASFYGKFKGGKKAILAAKPTE